jgi:hypothetical protein
MRAWQMTHPPKIPAAVVPRNSGVLQSKVAFSAGY